MSESVRGPDVVGFAPLVRPGARVLFLGNAPSVLSLQRQQYYGNPRNAFWPIMAQLCGFDAAAPYEQRAAALMAAGYAVWDVLVFCRRPGSLDSSVERDSMVANDFAAFYASHPTIERVFFTGGAAEANYRRLVSVTADVTYTRLPSTSPAHTVAFETKLAAWRTAVLG
ncbi:DNA-deoxyinosine glycosylase [Mycolicibacterium chitae]|uniref:G:T/U mismatch-specific DNA glycosylase n=2 Tax=Mycobacteriaceae TaxID=1762 RepID=A0A448I2Z3_MYCCI|nr:DNA-deoxyinosine glycosylase [Mycolicibacterium chitae]MCV7104418.1 DNA-deoxyinosine glycosylase [Mycolicibacterium chitae]VEG46690.1 G:T/U mismatch-specific DNA glycosylase [Mycolicibacterium chitae]